MHRSLVALLIVTCSACAGAPGAPARVAPAPLPAVPSPAARPRLIRGALLGHDGRPLEAAHVHVLGASGRALAGVRAGADGTFVVPLDETAESVARRVA